MKVLRSMSVFLPLALAGASVWPLACSDAECTTGTVRIEAALPEAIAGQATAVDVVFERGGQVIRMERLPVAPGVSQVRADITFPDGYPAGDRVVVSAVAKRLDAGAETAIAKWSATETFPNGCIGFVMTLFAPQTADGSVSDGSASPRPDAPIQDALTAPDASPGDGSVDSLSGDNVDAGGGEAGTDGAVPDASISVVTN